MAAHPELSEQDAETIVHWILSLADENKEESLPLEGIFVPANKFDLSPEGMVVISASYADKGTNKVPSLTGTAELILRNPVLSAAGAEGSSGVSDMSLNDVAFKMVGGGEGWLAFPQVNLEEVKHVVLQYGMQKIAKDGWKASLHLDKPDGNQIGSALIGKDAAAMKPAKARIAIDTKGLNESHDLYLVLQKVNKNDPEGIAIISLKLEDQ